MALFNTAAIFMIAATYTLLPTITVASSSYGKDFYIGFMRTTGGSEIAELRLTITTPSPSAEIIVETLIGVIYQGEVIFGSPVVVLVSRALQVTDSDFSNREKGIHVYSNGSEPIIVLAETVLTNLNYGAYLAYPCQIFESLESYEYVIISYDSSSNTLQSTLLLVGSKDNTSISIIPSQTVHIPGDTQNPSPPPPLPISPHTESHQFTLNRMQTLLVLSVNDLSGTRVISNKPLTVISGHECANVPLMASGCEPLAIQVPPTATWGTKFLLAPFAGRNSPQMFKAVKSKSNTSLIYTCENTSETVSMVTDLFFGFSTDKYCSLESSHPILIAQISIGEAVDSLGDPAIAMISPVDQYVHEIQIITLPTTSFPNSYISITIPVEYYMNNQNNILLDGESANCQWWPIYNDGGITVGYGCNMTVFSATNMCTQHNISHSNPGGLMSVLVYGFNTSPNQGYAYLAGQIITLTDMIKSTEALTTIEVPTTMIATEQGTTTEEPTTTEQLTTTEEPIVTKQSITPKEATTTEAISRCESETVPTAGGITYIWQTSTAGTTANFTCPLNSNTVVTRVCSVTGWDSFDEEGCGNSSEVSNQLDKVFNNLTTETYATAVLVVSQALEQSVNDTNEQSSATLSTVADYLMDLSTFVTESNVMINETVIGDVINVVNSLIQWDPVNIVAANSSSIIESFEVVASRYTQQLTENETQSFISPSVTLVTELRSVEYLQLSGRSLSVGSNLTLANQDQDASGQLAPEDDAAINLPSSLFRQIANRSTVGLFFALYNDATLFPVGERNTNNARFIQTHVGSHVLAATVGEGLRFNNLGENVTLTLRLFSTEEENARCVTWNFNIRDWTTEGCTTSIADQKRVVLCSCNHLTNFALLVDVCLRQDGCELLDSELSITLTSISYIGIAISISCLILIIFTMLSFQKIRQKVVSKFHIQLSLAIFMMLIVALVVVVFSAEKFVPTYGGCVAVSVLVHYFTLVAVMWMGAEALLMFQKLVIVFTQITTRYIIIVSITCWSVPLIFVLIPLTVDLATGHRPEDDIVVRRAHSSNDVSFCFLSHVGAFWGAFLAPILAVVIFNTVIFIRVIVVLVQHSKGTAARKKETVDKKTIIRLLISISGVMFLFGLTWLFAILTFSVPGLRETGSVLFTIFNSFQGLFIFLFFCVISKEARESWKEFLSCGRYKSQFLHPSHVKLTYSGGGTGTLQHSTTKSNTSTLPSFGGVYLPTDLKQIDYESCTLSKNEYFKEDYSLIQFVPNQSTSSASKTIAVESAAAGKLSFIDQSREMKDKKHKKDQPLKVRVRRNSSKKYGNHDIEVMEVDFLSSSSSNNSDDDGDHIFQ